MDQDGSGGRDRSRLTEAERDHFFVNVDGVEYAVIASSRPTLVLPEGLTDAEISVLMLILAGLSNEEIARARGRSLRTVANQVASILEKSGAASRGELCARCRGSAPPRER